ncbi:hypothetical protein EHE19_006500 [Ruminiclostridium herbifermentans]|uniref:Uncharacterized protein n=1 Tax=Ruminiclostridium herbifermentans TaxID=2488810 RepID=A0A4U7JB64_9FIRM|nr:hypothetical protein [Ruminiclostridium herbifermentans]QNU68085.1 hypothetical protein EHE19_006500 [Ruminiclostridium herbifermentans]
MLTIINQINNDRNWGSHIPESLLVAQMEIVKKKIEEHPGRYAAINNPIRIVEFEYYEGAWLVDLYREATNNIKRFERVLQQMKKDYSILIGKSMHIEKVLINTRPIGDLDIPQISNEIQQNKYTGIEGRDIFWDDNL